MATSDLAVLGSPAAERRDRRRRRFRRTVQTGVGLLAALALLLAGCLAPQELGRGDVASTSGPPTAQVALASPLPLTSTPAPTLPAATRAPSPISVNTASATPPATAVPTATPWRPTATPSVVPSPTRLSPTPTAQPSRPSQTLAAAPPLPAGRLSVPVSAAEVARGDPARPWVSLVFNAGAGYQPAPAILDTLRDKQVRTTFFLMGWWAEKQPALVWQIAAGGHEIASHGYEVFDLTQVSDAEVIADLEKADAVIKGITGQSTRPLWSPSAGYRDARVRGLAASLGYRPIYWTLDSGDWREDASAADVRQRVVGGAVNGAIIVMHCDSPRSAAAIAPVLPAIVDGLRERGFRLVTIGELITGQLPAQP